MILPSQHTVVWALLEEQWETLNQRILQYQLDQQLKRIEPHIISRDDHLLIHYIHDLKINILMELSLDENRFLLQEAHAVEQSVSSAPMREAKEYIQCLRSTEGISEQNALRADQLEQHLCRIPLLERTQVNLSTLHETLTISHSK